MVYVANKPINFKCRRCGNNRRKNGWSWYSGLDNCYDMIVLSPKNPRRLRRFTLCDLLSILAPASVCSPSNEMTNHSQMEVCCQENQGN